MGGSTPTTSVLLTLAAPFLLGVYLWLGARLRLGYDAWRDTMTRLGDGVDLAAVGWLVVNVVIAGLLMIFRNNVLDELLGETSSLSARLAKGVLALAAGLSVVIGLTAGRDVAAISGVYGTPWRWVSGVHLIAAGLIVVAMASLPTLVWRAGVNVEWSGGVRSSQFRVVNMVLAVALPAVIVVVIALFVWTVAAERRAAPPRNPAAVTSSTRPWLGWKGLYERAIWAVGYTWLVAAAVAAARPTWVTVVTIGFFLVSIGGILVRPGAVAEVPWRLDDMQRNIVYGSGARSGAVVLLRIVEPERFRVALGHLLQADAGASPPLIAGERRRNRNERLPVEPTITVGLTNRGIDRLNVAYRWHGPRADVFAEGMVARRDQLGDDPAQWEASWVAADVVVWLTTPDAHPATVAGAGVNAESGAGVTSGVLKQRLEAVQALGDELARIDLAVIDGPFPFNTPETVSQPWVAGVPVHQDRDPRGGGQMHGRWRHPVALGEFVLGQVDASDDVFPVPDPFPLFNGACFATVRQLDVDLDRAEQLRDRLARSAFGPAAEPGASVPPADRRVSLEQVGEYLIGRRTDGRSLINSPIASGAYAAGGSPGIAGAAAGSGPGATSAGGGGPASDDVLDGDNTFHYGADPFGERCPVGAHVRRANPRDSLGFDGLLASRHRMIRRGMPYLDSNGELAGLMFLAYHARIDDQFEFVQRFWLNDGGAFGLGTDPDSIAGHWSDGERQVVVTRQSGGPLTARTTPLATARGGAYLLVPSISGLCWLSTSGDQASETGVDQE